MKICWDNLEKVRYNSNTGKFYVSYLILYEHDSCKECNMAFLGKKDSKYCSKECMLKSEIYRNNNSNSKRGDKNWMYGRYGKLNHNYNKPGHECSGWKGGYRTKNIPMYDTYVHQLEPIEQCRRNFNDPNILEVQCTYCGKWHTPKIEEVKRRIKGIKSNDINRFYCSDDCKKECPIYHKKIYYKGQEGYNSREVQPELRQLVFIRDSYTCQKCEEFGGRLHCHHIDPVVNNPVESADIDNCITLCVECHKDAHRLSGCGYAELRKCA